VWRGNQRVEQSSRESSPNIIFVVNTLQKQPDAVDKILLYTPPTNQGASIMATTLQELGISREWTLRPMETDVNNLVNSHFGSQLTARPNCPWTKLWRPFHRQLLMTTTTTVITTAITTPACVPLPMAATACCPSQATLLPTLSFAACGGQIHSRPCRKSRP
jgi:hypothetical protein